MDFIRFFSNTIENKILIFGFAPHYQILKKDTLHW